MRKVLICHCNYYIKVYNKCFILYIAKVNNDWNEWILYSTNSITTSYIYNIINNKHSNRKVAKYS